MLSLGQMSGGHKLVKQCGFCVTTKAVRLANCMDCGCLTQAFLANFHLLPLTAPTLAEM
jgi:hypothetical protein